MRAEAIRPQMMQERSKEQASGERANSREAWAIPPAPRWHTAALVGLVLAVFAIGSLAGGEAAHPSTAPRSRLTVAYLPLLAVEWGLALYVSVIGRQRGALRSSLGKGWRPLRRAFVDFALALTLCCLVQLGELLAAHWFGVSSNAARAALLPTSPVEHVAWFVLAASAGFCEELVYRGYLLNQFKVFSGSWLLACVGQAALFGVAHAEQGAGIALRFSLYALLFGMVAIARRSLAAVVLAHVTLDVLPAILR